MSMSIQSTYTNIRAYKASGHEHKYEEGVTKSGHTNKSRHGLKCVICNAFTNCRWRRCRHNTTKPLAKKKTGNIIGLTEPMQGVREKPAYNRLYSMT